MKPIIYFVQRMIRLCQFDALTILGFKSKKLSTPRVSRFSVIVYQCLTKSHLTQSSPGLKKFYYSFFVLRLIFFPGKAWNFGSLFRGEFINSINYRYFTTYSYPNNLFSINTPQTGPQCVGYYRSYFWNYLWFYIHINLCLNFRFLNDTLAILHRGYKVIKFPNM